MQGGLNYAAGIERVESQGIWNRALTQSGSHPHPEALECSVRSRDRGLRSPFPSRREPILRDENVTPGASKLGAKLLVGWIWNLPSLYLCDQFIEATEYGPQGLSRGASRGNRRSGYSGTRRRGHADSAARARSRGRGCPGTLADEDERQGVRPGV